MTNAITQDRQPSATEKLSERVNTLTATTEQIRGELSKIRAEIDQVLEEVRSLPHGNEWARNGRSKSDGAGNPKQFARSA